jgi:hypothetical protein
MEYIRDDVIGGVNTFLAEQKKVAGDATLTLVQFDSQDPYEVIHHVAELSEIQDLTRETFVPRASTPLLDAMGRGINDLDASLAAMDEKERPARVVMVVVTDGQENASQEFRKDQIEKMLKEKQEAGWQVVFLSEDLNAIGDIMASGVSRGYTYAFGAAGVAGATGARGTVGAIGVDAKAALRAVSSTIADYRDGTSDDAAFTDDKDHGQSAE